MKKNGDQFESQKNVSRVQTEFTTLQEQGYLSKGISLKRTHRTDTFQAGRKKEIRYNPLMDSLSKSSVQFALFHEDGHHMEVQMMDSIWIKGIAAIYIPYLFIMVLINHYIQMTSNIIFTVVFSTIYTLIMIYVLLLFYNERARHDEFNADKWAKRKLMTIDPTVNMDEVASRVFKELSDQITFLGKMNLFHIIYGRLLHPSDIERIEELKRE